MLNKLDCLMNSKKLYKVSTDNNREYYVIADNYGDAEDITNETVKCNFTYHVAINKIEYINDCYYENN